MFIPPTISFYPVVPNYRYGAHRSPATKALNRGKDRRNTMDCERTKQQRNKEMDKQIKFSPF